MKIVGCDFHPSFQQVAILDISTGEVRELKLMHADGEAERFYRELEPPVLVGMESMGNTLWFERLLERLGHELWIGDASQIRASYVRRQKTDKRDAGHILQLLMERRFPRIWVPSHLERDQRQLLLHRHRLVQMRTKVKTELQHLALNQDLQQKRSLWSVRGGLIWKSFLSKAGRGGGGRTCCRCWRCWRARWPTWTRRWGRWHLPTLGCGC